MARQAGIRQRPIRRGLTILAASLLLVGVTPPVSASTEGVGRPFDPTPVSEPLYAVSETTDQRRVPSGDIELFLETWLPVAKDGGPQVPERVPTVLVMTPYAMEGRIYESYVAAREVLVSRGYAFAVMHTRGTGSSGGCLTLLGQKEAHDGAEVIAHIATQAPWSDGTVGTFGTSYVGGTQIATAAGGDDEKLQYLKAMVVGAPAASWYDIGLQDGVPSYAAPQLQALYYAQGSYFPYSSPLDLFVYGPAEIEYGLRSRTSPGGIPIEHAHERADCQLENIAAAMNKDGDVTPWYAERDWRRGVDNIRAATLMYHGHLDRAVPTHVQSGLFDRITAPKTGIFGDFGHSVALESVEPEETTLFPRSPSKAERLDFWDMVVAWYDQHLKGLAAETESWPVAQVEGSDGLWRAEPNWPATGGPAGHLVLGEGTLGREPAVDGSSTYTETVIPFDRDSGRPTGSYVKFESGPLEDRLEITGMPILDLWVELDKPDAHIAAEIETFDANGAPIETFDADGVPTRSGTTVGFRSMRHLDQFANGRFVQEKGEDAPAGVFNTVVRFRPVDLVVPAGGSVTLTIAGQQRWDRFLPPTQHPNWPSLSHTTVKVLHNCEHMSALRFVMPRERFDLLDVATPDDPEVAEPQPPYGNAFGHTPDIVSDGGIATDPICGQEPTRFNEFFGEEIK